MRREVGKDEGGLEMGGRMGRGRRDGKGERDLIQGLRGNKCP